jgi:hypothetical protein
VRIYVWMRYSAIRQLTWQRNYNTQPRILGGAQERLTHKIAEASCRHLFIRPKPRRRGSRTAAWLRGLAVAYSRSRKGVIHVWPKQWRAGSAAQRAISR